MSNSIGKELMITLTEKIKIEIIGIGIIVDKIIVRYS